MGTLSIDNPLRLAADLITYRQSALFDLAQLIDDLRATLGKDEHLQRPDNIALLARGILEICDNLAKDDAIAERERKKVAEARAERRKGKKPKPAPYCPGASGYIVWAATAASMDRSSQARMGVKGH